VSSSSPWHHLYNTRRWVNGRRHHLAEHPLCKYCELQGFVVEARVVDHIKPHKGDEQLFFDPSNWQSLCKDCHDRVKQNEELGRYVLGAGVDGQPIDPRHPWNASRD
jgi:5-methylcytosine-specific restriction protein A